MHSLKDYRSSASIEYFKVVVWSCTDHYNYSGKYEYGKRLSCQENKDLIGYTVSILKIHYLKFIQLRW